MEVWKDVPGYEGRYQVSDQGRVRSLDRPVRTVAKNGTETARVVRGRVLAPQKHSQGYQQVGLSGDLWLVHALVLLAFVGGRPPDKESAHGNGDKTDNRLNNLRYATPLENANDRRLHGTSGAGEANAQAKLSRADVAAVRAAAGVVPQRELAARYGVHQPTISKVVRKERWRHA